MKIVKWLSPNNSAAIGHALIRVEPNEDADIEKMLVLVDGDSVGHFGIRVELVGVGETMPEIRIDTYGKKPMGLGYYRAEKQFGFCNASSMKKKARYYDVFVHRD